jgi:hypothetical protein
MPKIVLPLLVLFASSVAQNKPSDFLLDPSKPYGYLKYDHIGSGKPQQQSTGPVRLWFRIVNNCRIPIAVRASGASAADGGIAVFYEVIPIGPPEISIQGDGGVEIGEPTKKEQISPPKGYSAEVASVIEIQPGRDLLFSVPRSHVSRDWFIRVKFRLVFTPNPGPYSELDFFEDQIPR